jgi:hypothetical protein
VKTPILVLLTACHADASLMQRVFCDNQELAFAQQQQQLQPPQQQEQQEVQPQQASHQNGTAAADS